MQPSTKGTVLIIEDNLLNLDMASELLELAGFHTFQAEDAITGMKLAKDILPDLILMDLHLPYQDGFVTTQTMKADPLLQNIPIVAFTALAMKEDQDKALAHGCDGVIPKPIDVNSFAQTVEKYISRNKAQHDTEQSITTTSLKETVSRQLLPGNEEEAPETTVIQPDLDPVLMYPELKQQSVGEQINPTDISAHKVLVVDDNPMNVELLRDALESMGQDTSPAYNGYSAIRIAQEEQPDLILLDIMMPDLDGYGVLEKLRQDPKTAEIPVIFISALNKTQDMVRGFKLGTYDYITKPFKIEEVKARILSSLRIKDLQDSLRTERDKLSTIFRFSADGIALLQTNMEVVSANPQFGEWFGLNLSPDGVPEKSVNFFQLLGCQCQYGGVCPFHTEGVRLVPEVKNEQKQNGGMSPKEVLLETATLTDKEGNLRYLNIHGGRVQGGTGQKQEGYVVVLRDVTREKTIQQSKETFVATLTHDLKTPIRAEYQALELLKSGSFGPLTSEQEEMLKEIIHSNRYMSQLVDSLLTTYMYEEGKMELNIEPHGINQLIEQDVVSIFKTLVAERHQTLTLQLAEGLPLALFDPIEIQRVLNNLVQNAITFTPEGGTITVSTESVTPEEISVSVTDTGRGIEAENIPLLFDRYRTMAKKFQQVGTGLGLYLSKKIIEAHGGQIGIESQLGKGSRFYFTVPVAKASTPVDTMPRKAENAVRV